MIDILAKQSSNRDALTIKALDRQSLHPLGKLAPIPPNIGPTQKPVVRTCCQEFRCVDIESILVSSADAKENGGKRANGD